jgi:type IV secretory pathway TrbL component
MREGVRGITIGGSRSVTWGGGQMASAVARAYSGGLGAEPPDGSRGKAPGEGSGGEAALKLTIFYY